MRWTIMRRAIEALDRDTRPVPVVDSDVSVV
jgi:hypothetical protein